MIINVLYVWMSLSLTSKFYSSIGEVYNLFFWVVRSFLRDITSVRHRGKTSFIELSLIRTTQQFWGKSYDRELLSLYAVNCFYLQIFALISNSLICILYRMQKLAKELGVVIPVSFFEEANNAHYNSIVVIDADGTDLGLYRKSHIPDGPGIWTANHSVCVCVYVLFNYLFF